MTCYYSEIHSLDIEKCSKQIIDKVFVNIPNLGNNIKDCMKQDVENKLDSY